eukprot:9488154-Pyramimonas_sp.AAC.1
MVAIAILHRDRHHPRRHRCRRHQDCRHRNHHHRRRRHHYHHRTSRLSTASHRPAPRAAAQLGPSRLEGLDGADPGGSSVRTICSQMTWKPESLSAASSTGVAGSVARR